MIPIKSESGMPEHTVLLGDQVGINMGGISPEWVQYFAATDSMRLLIIIQDLCKSIITEDHAIQLMLQDRERKRRKK